ncbi:T9SS type B sorting domain-containing protein [Ulvibacterium sp.]|uniref:T9SS type B sorting domain-containing protein n=1 Tax=Ulvibacterium sp. TaxID=2665914 RepID=UPI0026218985|nr:T9SS type B sorting domain-containing protein [Ulvibacterium sp.]
MKNVFPLVFSLFISIAVHAQREAAIWYFGRNAGVDFNSGTPVALTDGALNTVEGCATVSDAGGNLLFYTDGTDVWNRNHQVMPNGTGLLGNETSTQSAIVVPIPESPNRYYVLTVLQEAKSPGLNYSVLDMNLDGGLGDITAQKNITLEMRVAEKLTAVQHANKRDIWVLAHRWDSDAFLAYLVTPTGINPVPVESNVGSMHATLFSSGYAGYMKVSPTGNKLVACILQLGVVELFDFDNATGRVSNALQLDQDSFKGYYGAEFSPSGRFLYLTDAINVIPRRSILYQYDTQSADIVGSRTIVYDDMGQGLTAIRGLQLGIDGKIYAANTNRPFLSSIENPEEPGPACNFVLESVDLNGRLSTLGLPQFIQSFFLLGFEVDQFCLGSPTTFQLNLSEPVVSISWDFGDGNTSTVEDPSHTYAAPGTYTVTVTASTASQTKVETEIITISETPTANPTPDFEVCSLDPAYGFDLSTKDVEVLGTQSATDYIVAYYPSLTDAQSGANPLPTTYENTDPVETIFARISNGNYTDCYDITSFDLVVKQAPELHPVSDWTVCDTDTDGLFTFDLSIKDSEALNGQDPADFSVSYHTTQTDAESGVNPIGPNHTNTATPETIYFRIGNATYPECYETGSFNLEVIDQVVAHTPQDLDHCDDDNDGEAVFDLTVTEAEIIGSQNPAGLVLSYHESQADADSGNNALNAMDYLSTAYQNTIYVRVANTSDASCYDTTSFQLNIFDTPVLPEVSDWQVCDDDNDGRYTFDLTEKANEILAGTSVSFYESQANADNAINALGGTYQNTGNPQTLYYRMENANHPDCYATGTFQLQVFDTPMAHAPEPLIVCDTDGTGMLTLDLSAKDTEVLDGQDPNDFMVLYFATQTDADANVNALPKSAYTNTATRETLYARIQNNNNEDCHDVTSLELIINPRPQTQLEETYVICPDSPELTLDGGDFESWSWRDGNGTEIGTGRILDIAQLDDYSLTVTETLNGVTCERTVPFEVISSGAPDDFSTEIVGFGDRVTIVVTATGMGEFEYSMDGENYREDNSLEVFPGEYTVYVRDKFLCRTLEKEIIALGYQKFFTPNGDGSHEHWNIIGAERYLESKLYIYDRYGKLIAQVLPDGPGWDGTFRGVAMPSSDYWFRYELGQGKSFTGHFTLKR